MPAQLKNIAVLSGADSPLPTMLRAMSPEALEREWVEIMLDAYTRMGDHYPPSDKGPVTFQEMRAGMMVLKERLQAKRPPKRKGNAATRPKGRR